MTEKQQITACLAATLTNRFYNTLYDKALNHAKFAQKNLVETLRENYQEYWKNISENSTFVVELLEAFAKTVRKHYPTLMPSKTSDLYYYFLTFFIPMDVLNQMDVNEKGVAINDIIVKIVDQLNIELLTGNQLNTIIQNKTAKNPANKYVNDLQARIIYIIGTISDEMKTTFTVGTMTKERDRSKFVPLAEWKEMTEKYAACLQSYRELSIKYKNLQEQFEKMKRFREDETQNIKKQTKKKKPKSRKPPSSLNSDEDISNLSDTDNDDDSYESEKREKKKERKEEEFYPEGDDEEDVDYDSNDDDIFV